MENSEIAMILLPKNIYELSWINRKGNKCSKFFTKGTLLSFANNKNAFQDLRNFVSDKIRAGDY